MTTVAVVVDRTVYNTHKRGKVKYQASISCDVEATHVQSRIEQRKGEKWGPAISHVTLVLAAKAVVEKGRGRREDVSSNEKKDRGNINFWVQSVIRASTDRETAKPCAVRRRETGEQGLCVARS